MDHSDMNFKVEEELPTRKRKASSMTPKKEESEPEIEFADTPLRKNLKVPTRKALRAREKSLLDKFSVIEANIFNHLERDDDVVVDTLLRHNTKSALMNRAYDYTHLIKLRSDRPFNLVKTVLLREGEHAGHVAVLLRQSKPFPYMKLPPHIRAKIISEVVTDESGEIKMVLRQGGNKIAFAPEFSKRNRLALLRTCKDVYSEALPILYAQQFHFPGTQVIASFLLQIGANRRFIKFIRSDTYNSQSARTVFHLLQEATDFKRISFAHVSSNEQPKTAIKNIFNDTQTWLLGVDPHNPYAGIDILCFDHAAFHMREKDEHGQTRVIQWGPSEQIMFIKGLQMKIDQAIKKF